MPRGASESGRRRVVTTRRRSPGGLLIDRVRLSGSREPSARTDSAGINRHGVTNERVVKKGLANHLEPESCEGDREAALEALTGAYAGRGIELRNRQSGSRRCCPNRKATRRCAQGRVRRDPAES